MVESKWIHCWVHRHRCQTFCAHARIPLVSASCGSPPKGEGEQHPRAQARQRSRQERVRLCWVLSPVSGEHKKGGKDNSLREKPGDSSKAEALAKSFLGGHEDKETRSLFGNIRALFSLRR